jgi:beta-N-acetylhexosaminidase
MKETPLEKRAEDSDQAAPISRSSMKRPTSAPEPSPSTSFDAPDHPPRAPSQRRSQTNGNGHHRPADSFRQSEQRLSARANGSSPSAARPPTRKLPGRHGRFSPSQKLTIILALVVLVGALSLGAYAMLQLTRGQQQASLTPVATNGAGALPKQLDPERRIAKYIDQLIAKMTLDEEIGQMIMVEWDEGGTFNNDLQYMINNEHAGGIILYTFNNNIQTRPQVTALTAAIQAHAKIPLLISIDQEGGNVNRLDPITGPRPSARDIGSTNDPNRAYQQGASDGKILRELGFNVNLAPDVDVQKLSDSVFNASTMVGFEYRMYGTTPGKVAVFGGAYLNGLQDQGVIGTLKHWPGLGADIVDPHDALPTLNSSKAELNSVDFAPYRTLLAEGNVDMIMSTHELVPAYDKNLPATLSPILIDQVLRQQLGYQGVVITDGLYMQAISQHWSLTQAAVLAVKAGNDILLGPYNTQGVQSVIDALHAAVSSGQISKARIDLSVQRILALKIKYGLLKVPPQA